MRGDNVLDGSSMSGTVTVPGKDHLSPWVHRYARGIVGHDHPSADAVAKCVRELFTRATHRGGARVRIAIAGAGSMIQVGVTDDSAAGAEREPSALVARLAKEFGTRANPDGTTTSWFTIGP